MKILSSCAAAILALSWLAFIESPALANIPGGGNGTGPAVTLTDNGSTVTIANGIVSILCNKSSAVLSQISYTYNNSGTLVTNQLLSGGKDNGEFYWETGGFSTGAFTYSIVANNGNYCEIDLLSTSSTNGAMDVHFSMLRGSTGFYVTAIWSHRSTDLAMGMGETRDNIYLNPEFSWNSIDANRNFQYNIGGAGGGDGTVGQVAVYGAPKECTLWTNGIAQGRFEDKYKYVADFGTERAWGWSSVANPATGFAGQNIGIWHVLASVEYYNGGPMKPELMDAPMVNMLNGGHYYMGNDSEYGTGEVWTRVQGPYFVYCNNVTNTMTNAFQTAEALFNDAQAQAQAEATAWPYPWFTNASYAPASDRGSVSGQLVIADSGNPNASASNLWVGVVQQPVSINGVYDSQLYMKPYQFWVQTDANGNFTIPNVIAGANYTLWAFGPGINGTFLSQSQSGNYPSLLYSTPATQFSVSVTADATNNLGAVTWTNASRVGQTVFEIGYPDRTARKFRHGEDWWVGDIGPSPTNPVAVWSKFLEYPFDFPNGPNYVVGQSRWSTDWNFLQPEVTSSTGTYSGSTSTITFNLASAPTNNAIASLYVGLASDYNGPLVISVNGVNASSLPGLSAAPITSISSGGYTPITLSGPYSIGYSSSDTSVREFINAAFSDERLTFNASALHSGQNTITITLNNSGYFADSAFYDYIRLEMTGYKPPPPASVAAYPGNNCNLVCWPVTPGAISYNVLRSNTSGSGYAPVTNGVIGPVCGSGWNNATWTDPTAANGTTYYYVVQSVNPNGASANSPQSSGTIPSSGVSTSAPAAPTGLAVTGTGHQSVTLNWTASPGANYYTVYRSTLVDSLGGASNVLNTIVLNNTNTGTSYTDISPTDGSIYSYTVTATGAGGTSANSAPAVGVPLPAPPAAAPASLTAYFVQSTSVLLSWSPVPGAVGYEIFRSTSPTGPFAFVSTFVQSVTETTYTDTGLTAGATYYYRVLAVNAGGVSTNASDLVNGQQAAPASLTAIAGNGQVSLNWPAPTGATSYTIARATNSGAETPLVSGYGSTSYTDTGLSNGVTYYYVVTAGGAGGTSGNSPEASATPNIGAVPLVWSGATSTAWDTVTPNWLFGVTAEDYEDGTAVTFNDTAATGTVVITNLVRPASFTFANASLNYTLSGVVSTDGIAGATSLVKSNAASVSLSCSNSYTGGTFVNGGSLVFLNGTAIPASGTLTLNGTGSVTVATANSLPNVQVNGTNNITGNGNSGTGIATLNDAGTLTLFVSGGSDVFDLTGSMTGSGNLVLGSSSMTLRFNGTSGDGNAVFNLGTANAVANVRSTGTTGIALGGLAGGSGTQLQGDNSGGGANMTYTIGGANANTEFDGIIKNGTVGTVALTKTGTGTLTLTGVNTFSGNLANNAGTLAIGGASQLGGGSYAGTIANNATLVFGSAATQTLSGAISGTGALTQNGSGTLILTGTNTYQGGTTVNGGLLLLNTPGRSATGSGAVTLYGGTLGRTGVISGPVTVNAGGALASGNPLGTLTISNNLTLAAGSITFAQIYKVVSTPALTNSMVTITGTLTEGGTLNVTNIGVVALANGDSFKLFNAAGYSGSFAAFVLPPLGPKLAWKTSALGTSGLISVAPFVSPAITAAGLQNGSLVFRGTNAPADWTYYVLSSTNVALPLSQWTFTATNQTDANGNFSVTNNLTPNQPQNFLILRFQ